MLISYLSAAETEPPRLAEGGAAAAYSTGRQATVDDILTVDLVLAPGKVQTEGVHKDCTFLHCSLSFTYVILLFSL